MPISGGRVMEIRVSADPDDLALKPKKLNCSAEGRNMFFDSIGNGYAILD